jgi:hypothetical protein
MGVWMAINHSTVQCAHRPRHGQILVQGLALLLLLAPVLAGAQAGRTVYRCPGAGNGSSVEYTDAITAAQAEKRGCKAIEAQPVTILHGSTRPASAPARAPAPVAGSAAPRPAESRVDPGEQRARDSDARRILEGELRREEDRLQALRREFNNGEPERRGEERNYAKYQERVDGMKAAIDRKEADIAAIKRELSKLPAAASGAAPGSVPPQ